MRGGEDHRTVDSRGSADDRRRRRVFLIGKFGICVDGRMKVKCFHCSKLLPAQGKAWHVDRFPLCGHAGGRYTRDNIVPACKDCNISRCNLCEKP